MHRFFCPDTNFSSPTFDIRDKDELHHLQDVLRLKAGDTITAFNQNGEEAVGKILENSRGCTRVEVQQARQIKKREPGIVLACAVPKKGKFELIIEKATELGVDEIIPLLTRRTQVRISTDRRQSKHARYAAVALNAAKQSRRADVPVVHPAAAFMDALDALAKDAVVFIPSLQGKRLPLLSALALLKSPAAVVFLIGPEGDFTDGEYAEAQARGCIPVSLGENILRVETAAIVAVACASLSCRHD